MLDKQPEELETGNEKEAYNATVVYPFIATWTHLVFLHFCGVQGGSHVHPDLMFTG